MAKHLIYFIAALLLTLPASGQEAPPLWGGGGEVIAAGHSYILFGLGTTNQYDTYLSPLEYKGVQFSIVAERERAIGKHKYAGAPVTFQSLFEISLHDSHTPAKNADYLGGDLHYDAGWHYNWRDVLWQGLSLKAGGQVGTSLGFLYTTRSSNNPANARASLRLSASVGAQYDFHIKRTPLSLRYQADLPMLGAAFTPNYGQSYYEMWQYGYDHNIVCTHPGNSLSLRQLFTISIHLRRGAITVGYLSTLRQGEFNGIRQHQFARGGVIGWQKSF